MSRSGESLSPKREDEECSVVGLTRSSGESFDVLGETWTRPGECNSPKRELEAGSVRGARLGEVI